MPDTPVNIPDAIPALEPDIPAESFTTWEELLTVSAAALVLAGLILAALLYLRRQRLAKRAATATTPLETALQALAAMEEELPPLRPCALRLSLLLRTYLAGCAQDPALYETQEEFSQRMDSLENVPATFRPELRSLLDELAGYKYAAESDASNARCPALIERSRDLLQRLDSARAEEEAAKEKGGDA